MNNINQLISSIKELSNDIIIQNLAIELEKWIKTDSNILDLSDTIEHYFGNSWIESEVLFNKTYKLWSKFKKDHIDKIGRQTMNERLYHFGLSERFDSCNNEVEKDKIYSKVFANK